MDLAITAVPAWISILFVLSFSTIPVFLIANVVQTSGQLAGLKRSDRLRKQILSFFWVYLSLVAVVSLSGFFMENVIPPRIIITTTIPLFLFYLLYVQRTNWFKSIFAYIRLEQLIFLHVFRFVGVFFFLVYAYGAIPESFAIIGGSGDILTALLVFPVIYALRQKRSYAKAVVWIWNIIGLIDIFSVLTTATILTRQAVGTSDVGVQQFGTFPFSWIPAFAPATIIFLHILVFKKLVKGK